eukprot:m.23729 g.23729  ORF g.23729 m.23729 type:complete len:990 (-) comp13226_c0_seq2:79-3048(-)
MGNSCCGTNVRYRHLSQARNSEETPIDEEALEELVPVQQTRVTRFDGTPLNPASHHVLTLQASHNDNPSPPASRHSSQQSLLDSLFDTPTSALLDLGGDEPDDVFLHPSGLGGSLNNVRSSSLTNIVDNEDLDEHFPRLSSLSSSSRPLPRSRRRTGGEGRLRRAWHSSSSLTSLLVASSQNPTSSLVSTSASVSSHHQPTRSASVSQLGSRLPSRSSSPHTTLETRTSIPTTPINPTTPITPTTPSSLPRATLSPSPDLSQEHAVAAHKTLTRTVSLENLLTCAICLDILFEPVTSKCNHYFCLACVRRLLEYDGKKAPCPKCRKPLNLVASALAVDQRVADMVAAHYSEETFGRADEVEQQEAQYKEARIEREERERMMEMNPLEVMFANESDPERRAVMQRDLSQLLALGFSDVEAKKALFVCSGQHNEAINWLIQHQHFPTIRSPWNMTELQEQMAMRNTRRALLGSTPISIIPVIPGRLDVAINTVRLVGTLGAPCWCFVTMGLRSLGQDEIVVLLKSLPEEHSYPQHMVLFFKQLFALVRRGTIIQDLGFTEIGCDQDDPFLGDSFNSGFIYTRYKGQHIGGVPLPRTPHLFAVLLRGAEIDWAKHFPARLLLRLGKQFNAEFPFPLWSDRFRESLYTGPQLRQCIHLSAGMRIPDTTVMRVRTELGALIQIQLPKEAHTSVVQFLDRWPSNAPIPILAAIGRGCDSHLVYIPGNDGRTHAISLPQSQANCLGATHAVLVRNTRSKRNGGMVRSDGLVMNLSPPVYEHVIAALRSAKSCEVRATRTKYIGEYLSLRIQWVARDIIRSGLGHIEPSDFPSRNMNHIEALQAANVMDPMGTLGDEVPDVEPASVATHHVACPETSERVRVVSVTIDTCKDVLLERLASVSVLENFVCVMVEKINEMLEPVLIPNEEGPDTPSSFNLQIQLDPGHTAKYRIQKSWEGALPQAPSLAMEAWGLCLHQCPVPDVKIGPVTFQLAMQIT